eukprot:11443674-Ditylum_brightwellii.AAC.1
MTGDKILHNIILMAKDITIASNMGIATTPQRSVGSLSTSAKDTCTNILLFSRPFPFFPGLPMAPFSLQIYVFIGGVADPGVAAIVIIIVAIGQDR